MPTPRRNTQNDRITELEGAVDQEVIGAVGASMRVVVEKHEADLRAEISAAGLAAVGALIDAMPDYVSAHIWGKLQGACDESYENGLNIRRVYVGEGSRRQVAVPIKSVFGKETP